MLSASGRLALQCTRLLWQHISMNHFLLLTSLALSPTIHTSSHLPQNEFRFTVIGTQNCNPQTPQTGGHHPPPPASPPPWRYLPRCPPPTSRGCPRPPRPSSALRTLPLPSPTQAGQLCATPPQAGFFFYLGRPLGGSVVESRLWGGGPGCRPGCGFRRKEPENFGKCPWPARFFCGGSPNTQKSWENVRQK